MKRNHRYKLWERVKSPNILIKNVHIHEWSKYINVIYHHMRNLCKKIKIIMRYVLNLKLIINDLTKLLLKY